MNKAAKFVFWSTLLMFGSVLIFASYTGVYLTYVAIPVIVISGLIIQMTKPKIQKEKGLIAKFFDEAKDFIAEESVDAKAFFAKENIDLKKILKEEIEEIEKYRKNK